MLEDKFKDAKIIGKPDIKSIFVDYENVDIDSIPTACRKGNTDKEIIDNFIKEYGLSSLHKKGGNL